MLSFSLSGVSCSYLGQCKVQKDMICVLSEVSDASILSKVRRCLQC